MLELRCGTGHWTQFFTAFGFQVTAVDNSEAMLEIAKKKIKMPDLNLPMLVNYPFPMNQVKK